MLVHKFNINFLVYWTQKAVSRYASGQHVKLKAMGDSLMLCLDTSLKGCATESFIWDARPIICMNHHRCAFPSHSLHRLKYVLCFHYPPLPHVLKLEVSTQ